MKLHEKEVHVYGKCTNGTEENKLGEREEKR